jgi:hypothetical protein
MKGIEIIKWPGELILENDELKSIENVFSNILHVLEQRNDCCIDFV